MKKWGVGGGRSSVRGEADFLTITQTNCSVHSVTFPLHRSAILGGKLAFYYDLYNPKLHRRESHSVCYPETYSSDIGKAWIQFKGPDTYREIWGWMDRYLINTVQI